VEAPDVVRLALGAKELLKAEALEVLVKAKALDEVICI
jgi:hypothetical protein